jgi:hypothetical protein
MSTAKAVSPGVLLGVGIRARQQACVPRALRAARPDLLTVDDPLVAIEHGPGRERRQVGSAARFAEQLTPLRLTGEDLRQVVVLLVLAPVQQNGRRTLSGADGVEHASVGRRLRRREAVVDRRLEIDRRVRSAVPAGEVHPGQSRVVLRSQEGHRVR